MASKYIYDIKQGHYILNEAEEDNTQQNQDSQPEESDEKDKKGDDSKMYSLEQDPKVMAIEQEKTNLRRNYDNDMTSLNNQKLGIEQQLSEKGSSFDVRLDPALLDIEKKIQDRKFRFEKESDAVEQKLLTYKKQVSAQLAAQTQNESWKIGKYESLNESNVHRAKIYIDEFFGEERPLKMFRDAKKYLSATNLIYGKDRAGVFVICVDDEDFNILSNVLADLGYEPKEIMYVINNQTRMSRKDFILKNQG